MERHLHSLSYPKFVDTRASWLSLSAADIHQIGELIRKDSRNVKLGPSAVLVDTDSAFEVVRMLEALVEDICEVRPFRDEQEARAWLASK